jgi:translation initiation factor 2B subunit (eIF-2B alpha/beta/delta family)
MELNSKNEEFENSLKNQITEAKTEIIKTMNDIDKSFLNNINESALILTLSKFKNFKFFIKQFEKQK